jgi:Holliday junction resolvase
MPYDQRKGLAYEHELANDIYRASDRKLIPIRAGYSGNQVPPMPDIHLDDGEVVHALEIKRTKDDVSQIFETTDLTQLQRFATQYPRKVYPYLGVRFTRRQLILIPMWAKNDGTGLDEVLENAVTLCPVEAEVTRKNNFSVKRPDTDEWPSATKGNDATHVLDRIGALKGERLDDV